METLEYIIEDRTIAEMLGVQNFTNEESAVLELVKNAYDAKAEHVRIRLLSDEMIVEDDGTGMDREKILDAWMRVGKSEKGYMIGQGDETRVLAGSKGVGRFAIARLGAEALVYSKRKDTVGVLWRTDWNTNTLEADQEKEEPGTTIVIRRLRDNWTSARVRRLRDFLSRTYNDRSMKIQMEYQGRREEIRPYFGEIRLGVHCVSEIRLAYHANDQSLICDIESDEFKEDVARLCPDLNIKKQMIRLNMADELENMRLALSESAKDEDWRRMLADVGDFSAELFFSLKKPSGKDAEKFHYKHTLLEERYESGVVLYRNAFSISSYEGKKDWLGFGKRTRESPAAATHPTGAWRVRENQMSGKVTIDKMENERLTDMMNRQGLVENDSYQLFVAIIISGINCFERYRQRIIRSIKKDEEEQPRSSRMLDFVMNNPDQLTKMSLIEARTFMSELRQVVRDNQESKKRVEDVEDRYRYDIRLLNMLATSGLKAASIAHELHNDRNSIDENVNYIIQALKRYDLWDTVSDPEHREYMHRDIPGLLEKNNRINKKIVMFMDVMLSETEKKYFLPENVDVTGLLREIKAVWERDYAWIDIVLEVSEGLEYRTTKDIFQVIFDNLILNSIQQNDNESTLKIHIKAERTGTYIRIIYRDEGVGLPDKYKLDPMRTLEVHETSRANGHGIGMWIVNNTVVNTGGEVKRIEGERGYLIELILGGRV